MVQRALVQPEMLRWARESAGLTVDEVAERVQVAADRIISWESGAEYPALGHARLLARLYAQPFAAFFLPTPPEVFRPPVTDFRHLPDSEAAAFSSALVLEVRGALEKRSTVLELLGELGDGPPDLQVRTNIEADPEEVGDSVRRILGIDANRQYEWRSTSRGFRQWREAVERVGTLVFQANKVPLEDMRAFSLAVYPLPAIVVNRRDSNAGRTFSLLHEFAHLLLRVSGVCEPMAVRPGSRHQVVERFCNSVAGAALVPLPLLLDQSAVKENDALVWDDSVLRQLSATFKVSEEVVLRRLLTAGRTTQGFYEFKRRKLLERYAEPRRPRKKGFVDPVTNCVSRSGKRYLGTLLEAYAAEVITSTDVADYLGVKAKHIPGLVQALND